MKTKGTFSSLKRFLPFLMPYKKEIISAIFLGIISGIATVLLTYEIGHSVDQLIGVGQVDFSQLVAILMMFVAIVFVASISQFFIQKLGNNLAYLSVADLRKKVFEHLNFLPLKYYDQTPHGNIVSRFTNDMDNISVAASAVFNQLFSGAAVVIASLGFMLYLSPTLTLIVLVTTPIIFIVNWLVTKASQANFGNQQRIVGELSGFISEMVSNQKIVIAFQREQQNQQNFETINQELNVKGQKAQFSSSLTNPLSRFVDHGAYLMIGLIGGLLVLNGSPTVTVGVISSFIIYSSQFSKPFIELSGITTQIQTAIAGLDRAFEILDNSVEKDDGQLVLEKVAGKVHFENVAFSYDPKQKLISDFNFTAEPGETIAIVGRTGAGKSTLVNLLMRFYEVDQGKITVDDTDITDLKRDNLRQQFGMVLQDTWLFDASIRENLQFGNAEANDEAIYQALKKTYMYDFVMRLPKKLDSIIGTSGLKISEGQRQLLTIARTMLSNPPMLILDEATSSVDTLTEKNIQAAFLAMMEGKTSFVIAHRLSTIKNADKILVMEQGQIVEAGTHDHLLKIDGYYSQLYHAQFSE
ncbi:ABC transporter ATP-binding protein [Enterococcus sp. LJL90]